jgi:hypothetical protein
VAAKGRQELFVAASEQNRHLHGGQCRAPAAAVAAAAEVAANIYQYTRNTITQSTVQSCTSSLTVLQFQIYDAAV